MNGLRQLGIILMVNFIGTLIQYLFHSPIPGNVIGMILLLILLSTKFLEVEHINQISRFLLDHLAFFFIPAGVGLITQFHQLDAYWGRFLAVCLISTIIALIITGLTVQGLKALFTKRRTTND